MARSGYTPDLSHLGCNSAIPCCRFGSRQSGGSETGSNIQDVDNNWHFGIVFHRSLSISDADNRHFFSGFGVCS